MFCNKCGYELREGSAFCIRCGAPVQPINSDRQPTGSSETASGSSAVNNSQQTAEKPKSKAKKVMGIILMVVGLIAFIGSCAANSCFLDTFTIPHLIADLLKLGIIFWGFTWWALN